MTENGSRQARHMIVRGYFHGRMCEDDGAPRSWAAGVSSATRNPLARSVPRTSAVLTFEITAAYDGFPATCREGLRRVTVAPQHRKESSADAVRRCTQNTLMLPCGSKTVDHATDMRCRHRVTGGAAAQSPSACSACIDLLHLLRKSRSPTSTQPSWPGMSRPPVVTGSRYGWPGHARP